MQKDFSCLEKNCELFFMHVICIKSYNGGFALGMLLFIRYPHSGRSNDLDQSSHLLTVATRDLFTELDKNVKAVAPMQFWLVCLYTHLFYVFILLSLYVA